MIRQKNWQTYQQYKPTRFQKVYSLAQGFSKRKQVSLDEVFEDVVQLHIQNYSFNEIELILEGKYYRSTSTRNFANNQHDFDVWLTFGETGQGKSTFTNAVCGKQVAVEGEGIDSQTTTINIYESKHNKVLVIDTPGLFDTRNKTNQDISDEIVEMVQDRLKQNANIKAIFFIWCPVVSMRFRFDHIKDNLEKTLGVDALKSVIFLVNEISNDWSRRHEEAYNDFLQKLKENGLRNPVGLVDFKSIDDEAIQELKNLAEEVVPYRKEIFEAHREMIYESKFLEIIRKDEEEKRKRKEIEEPLKKQMKEMENTHKKNLDNMEGKVKNLSDQNKESSRKLEEYENKQKELERRTQSMQSENESLKRGMEQLREDNERALRREKQEHEMSRFYHQTFTPLSSISILDPRSNAGHSASLPTSQNLSITFPIDPPQSTTKHYKGGQFIPGGGHAPRGGIDLPVSYSSLSNSSTNSSSSVAPQSTTKHYKGGQFIPGGGRAPKGGIDLPI